MIDGRAAVMSYLHVQLSSRGRALHHSVHHTDQSLTLAHLWQTRKEKIKRLVETMSLHFSPEMRDH